MAISVVLLLITGIAVVVLWRTGYLAFWTALTCVLFGFALASTGLAPHINNGLGSVAGWVSSL